MKIKKNTLLFLMVLTIVSLLAVTGFTGFHHKANRSSQTFSDEVMVNCGGG